MIFVICKYRLKVYLIDGWNKKTPATTACSDTIGPKIDNIIDNQNFQTNKCTWIHKTVSHIIFWLQTSCSFEWIKFITEYHFVQHMNITIIYN